MECGRCSGEAIIKNGLVQAHQRYKCKDCGFSFTKGYPGKPIGLKQQALNLYLEGMGFRAIGRVLGVSNVSILNWIRAYGQKAEQVFDQQPKQEIKTIELDELHPYIGRKKTFAGCGQPSTEKKSSM